MIPITKDEAIEIMEILYSLYPNFNKRGMDNFNRIWIEKLMEGDYNKTLKQTNQYVTESPYPPSLADIIVKPYKHRDDKMPEKIREAEEAVRKEMADPEIAARRKAKIDKMRQKLERMQAGSRVSDDD